VAHLYRVKVHQEDVDSACIARPDSYIKFIERARNDWLGRADIYPESTPRNESPQLGVRRLNAHYSGVAHLGDEITIYTGLGDRPNGSLDVRHVIHIGDEEIFRADLVLFHLTPKGRIIPLPYKVCRLLERKTAWFDLRGRSGRNA